MTSRERQKIERVIRHLMADDCEFETAMELLCGMVGRRYRVASVLRSIKHVDFREIEASGPNRTFHVADPETKTCGRCNQKSSRRRCRCNGCKLLLCRPCVYTSAVDMGGPLCYECSVPSRAR